LSDLVFGREVDLRTHGLDRYGRTLAVIVTDRVDANLEQVRSGMAWVFERYISEAGAAIQATLSASRGRSSRAEARTVEGHTRAGCAVAVSPS